MAEKTLDWIGHRTHVFGMTVAGANVVLYMFDRCGSVRSKPFSIDYPGDSVPPEANIEGILQLISALASLCIMDDAQRGFNTQLFDLPKGIEITGSNQLRLRPKTGHAYVVKDVIVAPDNIFGLGGVLYEARQGSANQAPLVNEKDFKQTHTLKLQWHARPWESTQPLYARAEAHGIQNLAKVEEGRFGDLIGDGFRWHVREDLEGRFADVRPRLLVMKGSFVPLSFLYDIEDFFVAFKSILHGTWSSILMRSVYTDAD